MKRACAILIVLIITGSLIACNSTQKLPSQTNSTYDGDKESNLEQIHSNIVIVYTAGIKENTVEQTAQLLQDILNCDMFEIGFDMPEDFSTYEFILLGFEMEEDGLPQGIQTFLQEHNLGARTICPFVAGEGNNSATILQSISQLQPGALLEDRALLLTSDIDVNEVASWIDELDLIDVELDSE